jgi:hypothetical protein
LRDLSQRAQQADQMRQDTETGTQRLEMQHRLRLTAIEAARAKLLETTRKNSIRRRWPRSWPNSTSRNSRLGPLSVNDDEDRPGCQVRFPMSNRHKGA